MKNFFFLLTEKLISIVSCTYSFGQSLIHFHIHFSLFIFINSHIPLSTFLQFISLVINSLKTLSMSWSFTYSLTLFNWSVIELQCCVTFWCTTMWISYVCTYILSLLSLPLPTRSPHASGSSQSSELSSLCHTAASHLLFFHMVVLYRCPWFSPDLSHPLLPSPCPQVLSQCLCLQPCPADRRISTNLLSFISSVQSLSTC